MKRMYNKNVAKIFIISLILIGVIFGLLYFNLQSDLNKSVILSKMDSLSTVISKQHQNLIFTHIITIIILVFLAYSIIGVPLVFFYLFYESTSIGFLTASFYSAFKVKGLLFSLIYIVVCKLIYLIFLVYLSYISLKISKKMLKTLILKENESLYHHLKNMFLKVVISIIIVLCYDLFLYFLANPILNLFSFLIK